MSQVIGVETPTALETSHIKVSRSSVQCDTRTSEQRYDRVVRVLRFPERVILLTALLASVCGLSLLSVVGDTSYASAASVPTCTVSSLKISVVNGDGLHHGVELIRFKNETGTTCTLRGYPDVEALLLSGKAPSNLVGMYHSSRPGSTMRATDVEMAPAGGVISVTGLYPSKAEQEAFVPPLISLPAKTGWASSTLNWVDGPNTGTCPAFDAIRIGWGASFVLRPLGLGSADPLCIDFEVTPIVRGATGTMNAKATSSK